MLSLASGGREGRPGRVPQFLAVLTAIRSLRLTEKLFQRSSTGLLVLRVVSEQDEREWPLMVHQSPRFLPPLPPTPRCLPL